MTNLDDAASTLKNAMLTKAFSLSFSWKFDGNGPLGMFAFCCVILVFGDILGMCSEAIGLLLCYNLGEVEVSSFVYEV